jgi:mevalonate kinase
MQAEQLDFNALVEAQHEVNKSLKETVVEIQGLYKRSEEETALIVTAIDELKEQIRTLTDTISEAAGLYR